MIRSPYSRYAPEQRDRYVATMDWVRGNRSGFTTQNNARLETKERHRAERFLARCRADATATHFTRTADEGDCVMRWGDMPGKRERRGTGPGRRGRGGGGFGFGGMKLGIGSLILIVIGSLIFGVNPWKYSWPAQRWRSGAAANCARSRLRPADGARDGGALAGEAGKSGHRVQPSRAGRHRRCLDRRIQAPAVRATSRRSSMLFSRQRAVGLRAGERRRWDPFYCSGDRTLYLDTAFFQELHSRFGAPGDFAQAYVIARSWPSRAKSLGHDAAVRPRSRSGSTPRTKNDLSVRLELQADCYAGVWGFFAQKRNLLEAGDVEEGLRAPRPPSATTRSSAAPRATWRPESFTHGSAQQRMRWFKVGFDSGDLRTCNTFEARQI